MIKPTSNILNCDVTLGSSNLGGPFQTSAAQLLIQNVELKLNNTDEINEVKTGDVGILVVAPFTNKNATNNTLIKEFSKTSIPLNDKVPVKDESDLPTEFVEDFDGLSPDYDEFSFNKILDKPVVCRARASLPVRFLYIQSISNNNNKNEYGVFAKKTLPVKTLFGPMEGMVTALNSDFKDNEIKLLLDFDGEYKKLDVSNSYLSNWMRYIRPARFLREQNLILYQSGKNIYFSSVRNIKAKEELKVWYSPSYAFSRNLKLLPGSAKLYESKKQNNSSLSGLWCCTHCRMSFKSATLFNLHVLTHAADNIETNEKDMIRFEADESLGKIVNNTQKSKNNSDGQRDVLDIGKDDNNYVCNICSKSFQTTKSFESHQKYHERMNIYECPICKIKFLQLTHLRNHIPSHMVEGYFFCPDCDKKFISYKMVRSHIRTYHARRKFHCNECLKFFLTADKLKIHKLSHSSLREFLCASCGKQFKRKDKLSDHMKKFHSPGNEKNVTKNANKVKVNKKEIGNNNFVYKCHICVKGFKRRGMLVNHLANRHPEVIPNSIPELNLPILKTNKDFFCQYCDKVYKSSSKRKSHILKNHPGAKLPLSCRKVSKSTEGEDNGTYSQTVGSFTANPHGCDWCHKQYASKAKLLQHQRKKHNELLPKTLQVPRRKHTPGNYEDEIDIGKVTDSDILLFQEPTDTNISDGEFIIDANTLKRAIKGEVFIADCSPETLAELGQIVENRPDQYFRVYQTSTGITFARPVEVWDPLSTCQTLSPSDNSPPLVELKLN